MKILAIGDPHGDISKLRKIPKKGIDLIILTGDLGKADLARQRFFENIERKKEGLEELEPDRDFRKTVHMEVHDSTLEVLGYLSRFAPVYTIQGNVGLFTDAQARNDSKKYGVKLPSTTRAMRKLGDVHLIKNRLRVLGDRRIGFLEYFTDTCWVREFKPTDYKKSMTKAKKQTDKARRVLGNFKDLDILVCHQPPYGYLDKVGAPAPMHWRGKHAGSKAVLDYIEKNQPPYVLCGHIHEGEGKTKIGNSEVFNLGVGGHVVLEI